MRPTACRWLVLLALSFVPVRADTNTIQQPAPPLSTPVAVKPDEQLTTKISYDSQDGDTYVVSFNGGQNKIVMYGLPANFAEGDSLEGTFYPAGTRIVGTKKYHAYAVTKEAAASAVKSHANQIADLQKQIADNQKHRAIDDKLAAAEIQAYGSDYPDAIHLMDEMKELASKIDEDKKELAALKHD